MKTATRCAALVVALLALWGCPSDITPTEPTPAPEAPNVAGGYGGFAQFIATQAGGAGGGGVATAQIVQNGASLAGSSFGVIGLYTSTATGTVAPDGKISGGQAVLTVNATGCITRAPLSGQADGGGGLTLTASFDDAGRGLCPGAPVGLSLLLGTVAQ